MRGRETTPGCTLCGKTAQRNRRTLICATFAARSLILLVASQNRPWYMYCESWKLGDTFKDFVSCQTSGRKPCDGFPKGLFWVEGKPRRNFGNSKESAPAVSYGLPMGFLWASHGRARQECDAKVVDLQEEVPRLRRDGLRIWEVAK